MASKANPAAEKQVGYCSSVWHCFFSCEIFLLLLQFATSLPFQLSYVSNRGAGLSQTNDLSTTKTQFVPRTGLCCIIKRQKVNCDTHIVHSRKIPASNYCVWKPCLMWEAFQEAQQPARLRRALCTALTWWLYGEESQWRQDKICRNKMTKGNSENFETAENTGKRIEM